MTGTEVTFDSAVPSIISFEFTAGPTGALPLSGILSGISVTLASLTIEPGSGFSSVVSPPVGMTYNYTASNIASHAQLFRIGIVSELLAGVFVVILNAALYQLLSPVHRSLARFAAFWRIVEVAVGSAIAVSSFIILSILSGAEPLQAFEPREVQGLMHLLVGAQESGYMIILLFFGLGSATYMYLLVRSRYVPRALAIVGLVGSASAALFALTRMLFPTLIASAFEAVRALPTVALVLLALVFVPILLFEFVFGLWLLVKGVRTSHEDTA